MKMFVSSVRCEDKILRNIYIFLFSTYKPLSLGMDYRSKRLLERIISRYNLFKVQSIAITIG